MRKALTLLALGMGCLVAYPATSSALTFVNSPVANTAGDEITPDVNAAGDIVWAEGGEIFLMKVGQSAQNISNSAGVDDAFPQLNSAGHVVWEGKDNSTQRMGVYFYDGVSTTLISDPNYSSFSANMNDNDEIVWVRENADNDIFLYTPGVGATAISVNNVDDINPKINNSGIITWQGIDAAGGTDYDIFRYDGVNIVKIHLDNNIDDTDPQINNNGDIVWVSNNTGTLGDIYLKPAGGTVVQISTDPMNEQTPVINDNGSITWVGNYNTANEDIFAYFAGSGMLKQISTNLQNDSNPYINNNDDIIWDEEDESGNHQIMFYDYSGNNIVQVSPGPEDNTHPHMSDNTVIVYPSLITSGNNDIIRADINTTVDSDGDTYTIAGGDCDDGNGSINPGAQEICGDGIDNNCDTVVDENCTAECGNGVVEAPEECDDGNLIDGDACSSSCTFPPILVYNPTQITTSLNEKFSPRLNSSGDMVWTEKMGYDPTQQPCWQINPSSCQDDFDTEVFFYDHNSGLIYQLTSDLYYDRNPVLNEAGDVAWYGSDGGDEEVYLFQYDSRDGNGNPITQDVTYGLNTYNDSMPFLNDNDEIVWEALRCNGKKQINYANYFSGVGMGGKGEQITCNAYGNFNPKINNNGKVVWFTAKSGEDEEIYYYDFTEPVPTITPLTNNSVVDRDPDVNDNGDVAWTVKLGIDETGDEIMFYDASTGLQHQITSDSVRDKYPRLNSYGDIAFQKHQGGDSDIYAYKHADDVILEITNNAYEDVSVNFTDSGDIIWVAEIDPDPDVGYSEIQSYNINTGGSAQITDDLFVSFAPDITSKYDSVNGKWDVKALWGTFDSQSAAEQLYAANQVVDEDKDGDGWTTGQGDCDDNDPNIFPSANPETLCDGKDNNCNGQIDEGLTSIYYADIDSDNFGDMNDPGTALCPADSAGYVLDNTDCNDLVATTNPGAPEICGDSVDNNCDGQIDENMITWYYDSDQDGFGDPAVSQQNCADPDNPGENFWVIADPNLPNGGLDCNDANNAINPGQTENTTNGIDDNCNGYIDESGMPAKLESNGGEYTTIQDAYNAIGTLDTINVQAMEIIEDLTFNRNVIVYLVGGWDSTFTNRIGFTTVTGITTPTVIINNGTVYADGLIIK